MNTDDFFERLHGCLDERCDPLDDPELVAFLDKHPELLADFAALRSGLRTLAAAPPVRVRRRWPWLVAVTAAAAAAIVLVCTGRGTPTRRGSDPRILDASVEELRPRAHIAANFTVRQSLLRTETTSFETWEYRSEPR